MTRALLPLLLTLAACGGEPEATTNQTPADANDSVMAPINNSVANEVHDEVDHPAPLPRDRKPLVSRETSTPHQHMPVYRAIGTEPFWAVAINGSTATMERPDKPASRFAVSRDDDGRAIRYLGDGFAMTVTPGPCSDGMSDAIWSDRVQIAFGEGTLKGCGGQRDDGMEPGDY